MAPTLSAIEQSKANPRLGYLHGRYSGRMHIMIQTLRQGKMFILYPHTQKRSWDPEQRTVPPSDPVWLPGSCRRSGRPMESRLRFRSRPTRPRNACFDLVHLRATRFNDPSQMKFRDNSIFRHLSTKRVRLAVAVKLLCICSIGAPEVWGRMEGSS